MSQPITREEQYLSAMASGNSTDIKPVTREEVFLAKATGQSVAIPEPITRKEVFLRDIALNGSGGGSVILKPFTLTEGGNYKAVDYGADGFSSVFADVDPAPIWDGDFTIVGTPEEGGGGSDNSPKAYHLSSADELPEDALDGSLAVVEDNNLVGVWLLNDELTKFVDTGEEVIVNVDFYCLDFPEQQYDGIIDTSSYPHFCYLLNGDEISDVYDDGWYICNDAGCTDDHFLFNKIVITKDPTDEIFRNWLPLNGKRISGSPYTLYSRENGEWVNKGEI